MIPKMNAEEIREYWDRQAQTHGVSHAASWTDRPAMEMEIREIANRIVDGDRILDIGCANGWSTVQYVVEKKVQIRGLDISVEMINEGKRRLAAWTGQPLRGRIEFAVGNILDLTEEEGSWDKVVVVRVVINLGAREQQAKGLREAARVVRPGGLLLLSEATLQGWRHLNAFRAEWGLDEIPMPAFNNYLDEETVVRELSSVCDLVEISNFASTYFVGTRVIKPLLARATGAPIDVSSPDCEWNRFFSGLPSCGDYGTQKLFVFRKR